MFFLVLALVTVVGLISWAKSRSGREAGA